MGSENIYISDNSNNTTGSVQYDPISYGYMTYDENDNDKIVFKTDVHQTALDSELTINFNYDFIFQDQKL